jgi:hypothetical protein
MPTAEQAERFAEMPGELFPAIIGAALVMVLCAAFYPRRR